MSDGRPHRPSRRLFLGRAAAAGIGTTALASEITRAATPARNWTNASDVIVVGSKGMTSAKRFVLGNVPNKVSHHAPCDVVIVHTAP